MANRRISELQEQAGLLLAEDDLLTVVNVSEPDPGLKNKKLTISGTKAYLNVYYLPRTGGTVSGDTTVTGTIEGKGTISGVTVTGTHALFTNATVTNITGTTVTGTSALFTNVTATNITGTTVTGTVANFTNINAVDLTVTDDLDITDDLGVGGDLTVTGTVEGKGIVSGVTVTGTHALFTNATATNITGTTITGGTIKMSGDTVATQTFTDNSAMVFAIALG